jgi:hypothetical protein
MLIEVESKLRGSKPASIAARRHRGALNLASLGGMPFTWCNKRQRTRAPTAVTILRDEWRDPKSGEGETYELDGYL